MSEIFYNFFGLNKAIFTAINLVGNKNILPYILYAISSMFFITNFAICYILVCMYFYFKTKRAEHTEKYFTPIYNELVRIAISYTIFGLIFAGLKFLFSMPRPLCSMKHNEFETILNIEIANCKSSFPSAHTGLSILVVYILWPYINSMAKLICCILIASVAISRISLAMHYPADIIYSTIITIIIISISNSIYRLLKTPVINPIKKKLLLNLFY